MYIQCILYITIFGQCGAGESDHLTSTYHFSPFFSVKHQCIQVWTSILHQMPPSSKMSVCMVHIYTEHLCEKKWKSFACEIVELRERHLAVHVLVGRLVDLEEQVTAPLVLLLCHGPTFVVTSVACSIRSPYINIHYSVQGEIPTDIYVHCDSWEFVFFMNVEVRTEYVSLLSLLFVLSSNDTYRLIYVHIRSPLK